jgi:hypothetical protein
VAPTVVEFSRLNLKQRENQKNKLYNNNLKQCIYGLENRSQKSDRGSVDQISLDLFSWSKFSVKFGIWSKLFFSLDRISLDLSSWSKVLIMEFWVILNFRSTAKICKFFFGSWLKVLIMVFWPFYQLSIKCQNPWVLFWQLIECTVG